MPDPQWYLVCVTRIKNEQPYLHEWLEYHLLVGVLHFFLYDMDDSAASRALLAPYEKRGLVTRVPWAHYEGTRYDRPQSHFYNNKSSLAFRHFALEFRGRAQWALKLDADEFLFPLDADNVIDPLQRYDPARVRGLSVPRFNFGDCGHETRPRGLVIESYLKREAAWSSYKDIGSGRYLSRNLLNPCPHAWHYRWFSPPRLDRSAVAGLRINHYFSKSFEEFRLRQNTNRTRLQTREYFEFRNRASNEVADESILRFVPAVKAALSRHARSAPREQPRPPAYAATG